VVRLSFQRTTHLHGPSSRILGEEVCDRPGKKRTIHKPMKRASPLSGRAHYHRSIQAASCSRRKVSDSRRRTSDRPKRQKAVHEPVK